MRVLHYEVRNTDGSKRTQQKCYDELVAERRTPSRAEARIVLVDDDDSFRESLGLNLLDEGFDVASFSGGAAALDHFERGGTADAILLDWRMPGMNGLEVLRRAAPDRARARRSSSSPC